MSFAMAIAMLFVGACLIWVAAHGTEATTPWGVFQQVTGGLSGEAATSREESADATAEGGTNGDTVLGGRTGAPAGPA